MVQKRLAKAVRVGHSARQAILCGILRGRRAGASRWPTPRRSSSSVRRRRPCAPGTPLRRSPCSPSTAASSARSWRGAGRGGPHGRRLPGLRIRVRAAEHGAPSWSSRRAPDAVHGGVRVRQRAPAPRGNPGCDNAPRGNPRPTAGARVRARQAGLRRRPAVHHEGRLSFFLAPLSFI